VAGRLSEGALDTIMDDETDSYRAELSQPFAVRLFGPAWVGLERAVKSVTPGWWLDRLRRNAKLAGLGRWGIEGILAMKVLFGLAVGLTFPILAALAGATLGRVALWAVVCGTIGFFVPDLLIARKADGRQDEIRRDLPETLDLMAIAVQAGMGLEGAVELVARRLPGALGEEFHRMLQEVQLGATRREALTNLRQRTEVQELSTFALSLAQADALGTPLGEVLRAQAAEMRMLRRQRAREQAAKTPVKLLFPLLVGIFPAMFVVVVGPAVISIVQAFSG
jgi:tight adherence protein C